MSCPKRAFEQELQVAKAYYHSHCSLRPEPCLLLASLRQHQILSFPLSVESIVPSFSLREGE